MATYVGGKALPSDWGSYGAAAKIAWFNANGVTPQDLLGAGVPQGDIDWMLQNGYTAPAAASTSSLNLPSDWSQYGAADKIRWFNQNNITQEQLRAAGVSQDDLNWMSQNGYTGTAPVYTGGITTVGGVTLPQGWTGFTPQQKIDWYNQNGITADELRAVGVPQDQLDWMLGTGTWANSDNKAAAPAPAPGGGLGFASPPPLQPVGAARDVNSMLPPGWADFTAQQKMAWFNQNNIQPSELAGANVPWADINWMLQNGYTPKQTLGNTENKYGYNWMSPQMIDRLDTPVVSNAAGAIKDPSVTAAENVLNRAQRYAIPTTTYGSGLTNLPAYMSGSEIVAGALPAGWTGFTPGQKINWFNQNQVSTQQLMDMGASNADINWMKTQGYSGGIPQTPVYTPPDTGGTSNPNSGAAATNGGAAASFSPTNSMVGGLSDADWAIVRGMRDELGWDNTYDTLNRELASGGLLSVMGGPVALGRFITNPTNYAKADEAKRFFDAYKESLFNQYSHDPNAVPFEYINAATGQRGTLYPGETPPQDFLEWSPGLWTGYVPYAPGGSGFSSGGQLGTPSTLTDGSGRTVNSGSGVVFTPGSD